MRDMFKKSEEWSDIEEAYDLLHAGMLDSNFDLDPEFYECWKILRNKDRYKSAAPYVHNIFDSAYEKYILKRKTRVDLVKVFADLAHKRCDVSEAIKRIRQDYYNIGPNGKERPFDPLLTEGERQVLGLKGLA
jgi:hypothetical protein